jgi:dienelactone hydrolase
MINESSGKYNSPPKLVGYELFEPVSGGLHSAVVILPGTFGFLAPWGEDIRSFARGLAEQGIVSLISLYFERTDTMPGAITTEKIIQLTNNHGDDWNSAIDDGIKFIISKSNVDSTRIGLLGFSLGGNRALSVAMKPSSSAKIGRVVEFFAPTTLIPLSGDLKLLPKLQIHHGDNTDEIVPPSETDKLIINLKGKGKVEGTDFEVFRYPGAGHGFKGNDLKNSREETIKFFKAR